MRHALRLADRALGTVAPNPAVGCVIVSADGLVVGRGWTAHGGRPHGETVALAQAGEAARGGTAYVTLEPCAHQGQTPPCATALIGAGVARVVAAAEDPDPRVHGKGFAMLQEAGIKVEIGPCGAEATELNAGFFKRVRQCRPLVTLKIAQSLDGKTATSSGQSKWITGEAARVYGHLLRARSDAVLVGIGTALIDDPELTCRVPGLEDRSPVRVVLDTRLRLNEWSKLAQSANQTPTLVFTTAEDGGNLAACGVEVVKAARDFRGRPDAAAVLAELGKRGITRLLVEGGASVHATFLDRGLADRLEIFSSPMVLGAAGQNGVESLAAMTLGEAPRFKLTGVRKLGPDLLESFAAED
ncbi:MAG: bifunctional diaminohydroxyphosphoribosylaminopyrimidine deaminase/5-amino-6-(5-phosphoribosylamino)uracil reductase RibD [Alphaproteobacteria bacterium]|nr:bifunctional diaminohydroxyphosphoribosylaminopyrimidine deaminase/5-amino-6-(5-phosphoribosylamino)uracil reductase RibD [Alphaproteobacteria bacterium]MDE2110577.1 bifunctional diaminohydroxyphosphoribosylaminopyrimidine deaminase/5-amino-6-(5-phosphoribosylamino)uracil reductase RibD [Alphaproteobacteria bacterium]MDE2492695.1 bifunctional diaminohydroxyphosphoribosylaminopyrimidine deaminase/5-amino-6-(5-phosphoribosylamino)uracil reductase RibD [Alphaproteobacteria bacterium]